MKQELQNYSLYAKKGFLFVELLLAMSILATVLVPLAFYQMQTYTLYKNAQKRHHVLHLVDTVFETIRYTKNIHVPVFCEDGITITIKPVSCGIESLNVDTSCIFVEVQAAWTVSSGLQEKASFVSLILMSP